MHTTLQHQEGSSESTLTRGNAAPPATIDTTVNAPTLSVAQAPDHLREARRHAGMVLVVGVATMVVGAAIWASTGIDLDVASQTGTTAAIMEDVVANSTALSAVFVVWLSGMVWFAIASRLLGRLPMRAGVREVATASLTLGATFGGVSYLAFLTVVHGAAPSGGAESMAAWTWFASNLDWAATILVLAIPVPCLVLFGDVHGWFSPLLRRLSLLPMLAGVGTAVALLTGNGISTFGFLLVPIGMIHMASTGITLWRNA